MKRVRNAEESGTYAIGNGRILVYGRGADLLQLQAPVYSMPSFAGLSVRGDSGGAESSREPYCAAWKHSLPAAELLDYTHPAHPVFVRQVDARAGFEMELKASEKCRLYSFEKYLIGSELRPCWLVVMPKGTEYFHGIATQEEYRMLVIGTGAVALDADGKSIHAGAGRGALLFVADRASTVEKTAAYAVGNDRIFDLHRSWWKSWLENGMRRGPELPEKNGGGGKIAEACETAAVMIKCQQSYDGGVAAGHYYPMAYVRDQAGVMRGLLHMGFLEDSRAILDFWYRKWLRFGDLHNAECMGGDAGRLSFSNDQVELPSYILLCAASYFYRTKDGKYFSNIFPMLEWALCVQLPHLAGGMTGFSGDETYIAGKTLPRRCLHHGSAESTMLLITGAERMAEISGELGLLKADAQERAAKAIQSARELFAGNFIRSGRLYANQPLREQLTAPPRYQYGFCERHEKLGKGILAVVEREGDGYYRCPDCLGKPVPDSDEAGTMHALSSVSLLPAYHEMTMFTAEQAGGFAAPYIAQFEHQGILSSNYSGGRALGYDMALLLCTLTLLRHPLEQNVLNAMLDMRDPCGMWAEYYDDMKPAGCRCRPWESAVCMEAVCRYLARAPEAN